jgi:AraC family transcriptional regulator of adaptative response/methylated-DNA-[protein]-cysteine methyltransferase
MAQPNGVCSGTCVVATIETPLGDMLAASHDGRLCLLEYSGPDHVEAQLAALSRHFGNPSFGTDAILDRLRAELAGYFAGTLRSFNVPLAIAGTSFQERVWAALLRIPYGETRSYEELARSIGAPGGQRAVGLANGSNRLAIVIPCHRVINKSGKPGGYGGELWRKKALLALASPQLQRSLFT